MTHGKTDFAIRIEVDQVQSCCILASWSYRRTVAVVVGVDLNWLGRRLLVVVVHRLW